jgi:hypothetical protein
MMELLTVRSRITSLSLMHGVYEKSFARLSGCQLERAIFVSPPQNLILHENKTASRGWSKTQQVSCILGEHQATRTQRNSKLHV